MMLRTIDLRGRALSVTDLLTAVPRAHAARDEALHAAERIVADVAAHIVSILDDPATFGPALALGTA